MRSIRDLDGETRVVGVIGQPVRHSLSPPMQNAALETLGLNWVYVPFEVPAERVREAIRALTALGIVGLNVTVPHKEAVAELVDERDETAGVLGAVNTVWNDDGTLRGYNTDGEGFLRSLREAGERAEGKRVVLIGAGGAARSVAYAVAREGAARLVIVNRTPARGEQIARLVAAHTGLQPAVLPLEGPQTEQAVREAELVIHSTPRGMHPHSDEPPVIPTQWLHEGQCVCDLVYRPRETTLLRAARAQNARTIDGTGMLVHQGAITLERWTGLPAPAEVMRQALLAALAAREAHGP